MSTALNHQAICDRAADAISALFDPANPPLTGIVIGAGAGELSSSLLVSFPQMSFWLVDQWKDKAADHVRAVESKTAFAHDRRRVVNLTSSQAERRCPFRSIELVVIDGMRTTPPAGPDAIRDQMIEQLKHWEERLRAGDKRFIVPTAGGGSKLPQDVPLCAMAYVNATGHVVFYAEE